MDVLVLIDKLDDLVHNAKAVPLTDQVRIDREEIYEAGDAFYTPPGHRPYVEAGTELLQFSPSEALATTERAIQTWMAQQQGA